MDVDTAVERELEHLVRRLVRRFETRFTADEVREVVLAEAARLGSPRVDRFVPVLVERRALARLTGHPSCVEEPELWPDGRARSHLAS